MTDTNLDRMTPQTCPAGIHADWAVDSEHAHACPWCRIAELEAEFTGRLEWTIGATDDDGETYYGGSYTENGARFHAARRQGDAFPAYRRETVFHRVDNTAEEAEFAALRAAAGKDSTPAKPKREYEYPGDVMSAPHDEPQY